MITMTITIYPSPPVTLTSTIMVRDRDPVLPLESGRGCAASG